MHMPKCTCICQSVPTYAKVYLQCLSSFVEHSPLRVSITARLQFSQVRIQLFHYIQITTLFSFLIKSSLVKLEISHTVILPPTVSVCIVEPTTTYGKQVESYIERTEQEPMSLFGMKVRLTMSETSEHFRCVFSTESSYNKCTKIFS